MFFKPENPENAFKRKPEKRKQSLKWRPVQSRQASVPKGEGAEQPRLHYACRIGPAISFAALLPGLIGKHWMEQTVKAYTKNLNRIFRQRKTRVA